MTGKKYKAEVRLSLLITFEDDGDLCLQDQAMSAASDIVDQNILFDVEVIKVKEDSE
ncbi:hypothetical protein MRBLRH13_000235 [Agrobacterium radiobacter]|uniref:hypothetical protein n=1 Tax=Agrobacterium radiobacter TaxID=362 RepID=UPI003447B1E4